MNSEKAYVIILVNFKGHYDTIECMESIFNIDYKNFKLIIVDNSENDESINVIKNWALGNLSLKYNDSPLKIPIVLKPLQYSIIGEGDDDTSKLDDNFIIIKAKKNDGFAAANNIGIKFAQKKYFYEWIWLLNNDTIVNSSILKNITVFLNKNKGDKLGMVGTNIYFYNNPKVLQGIGGVYNKWVGASGLLNNTSNNVLERENEFKKADYIIGASMFVSKLFIEDVGLMEERFFLYYEELDWATRGKRKKWAMGYCSDCDVYHKEGATIGTVNNGEIKSDLADYHGIRSKWIFTRKNHPAILPLIFISLVGSFFLRLLRGQFKRAYRVIVIIFKELFFKHGSKVIKVFV